MVLIGLVINEAITNIFKHAFPDNQEGLIQFSFEKKSQYIVLRIEDDGIGLPIGVDAKTNSSFGLQLIQDIATKLKAKYQFANKEKGCILQMEIPFEKITV
jgi:two-component sensor histidine kinase